MDEKLTNAVFAFNRLQSENNNGAGHDLLPAQKAIRNALSGFPLQAGLIWHRIETDDTVAPLRNRLDDWNNYPKENRAAAMRQAVLMLMEKRNAAARSIGYDDFPAAILSADGVDEKAVEIILTDYLEQNTADLHRLMGGIRMEDWFDRLEELAAMTGELSPIPLLEQFAGLLGIGNLSQKMQLTHGSFAYAAQLAEEEILLSVSPIRSLRAYATLFHELGHGILYLHLPKNGLPTLTRLADEMFAVLCENAAVRTLQPELRDKTLRLMRLEYARTAVSGLFELALWKDQREPEALYARYYQQLGVALQPERWSLDSFRSIDPMTIMGYTLGQSLADDLTDEELIRLIRKILKEPGELTAEKIYRCK